jgi:Peptidase family M20/M25/M40
VARSPVRRPTRRSSRPKLLARLHDGKARVTLPGFYDDVAPPSAHRRAELAALPFSDEDWLSRSESRSIGGEVGYTVPDQRAADVADGLRRWVDENIGDHVGYDLSISEESAQEPYRTPDGHPAVEASSAAMEDGFGRPAGRMGNAGGGPAELLARTLDAPVVFFGTGLPEDRWHDSDERVAVDMLINGAATLAHLWPRLAALGAPV